MRERDQIRRERQSLEREREGKSVREKRERNLEKKLYFIICIIAIHSTP